MDNNNKLLRAHTFTLLLSHLRELSYDIKSLPLTIDINILKQININKAGSQLVYQQNTCTNISET